MGMWMPLSALQIWMMPHGRLSLYGFAAQQVFLKGFLQKYGIEPLFSRRRDYKNAANFLTEVRRMLAPSRSSAPPRQPLDT